MKIHTLTPGLMVITLIGCAKPVTVACPEPHETHAKDDHAREPGPHGGRILHFGKNHAELCIDRDMGKVTLWLVDDAMAKLVPVDSPSLTLNVTSPARQLTMPAEPHASDPKAEGRSSRFSVTDPAFTADRSWSGTIAFLANGKPYALDFTEIGAAVEAADPKEDELYLKPGGLYTIADIEANGRTTVSSKYKSLKISHDIKPKPGDRLCPVTLTKANEKLTWVIGGKTYEFCCPPCVDEYVGTAKTDPAGIKPPEAFIKK